MISRSALGPNLRSCLQRQCRGKLLGRRGLAAPASGTFTYETDNLNGIKFASRDLPGPTTTLAVVARAGTRHQALPGFADGLENFAFKATEKRSALRITREAELLGGQLSVYHSRENLVLQAKFLKEDLAYFVELLGEVISQTRFTEHEFQEDVLPVIKLHQKKQLARTDELAINSVHGLAFHRGLGTPLHPTSSTPLTKYLTSERLKQFSQAAYAKSNFAIVANGTSHSQLSQWVGEYFSDFAPTSTPALSIDSTASHYFGGEERIAHDGGNNMVIAFPGSSSFTGGSFKPEVVVLTSLLGGQSSIKWSPGFSLLSKATVAQSGGRIATHHATYSDAGLLYITLEGRASQVSAASQEVVKVLKSIAGGEISKEVFKKAVAAAKFEALESGESLASGLELTGAGLIQGGKAHQIDEVAKAIDKVTEDQVKKAAKSLLDGKASVSTVGDLYQLPFAEEIGLRV